MRARSIATGRGPTPRAATTARAWSVVELRSPRAARGSGSSHVSSPRRACAPHAAHGSAWSLRWRPSANVPSLRSRRPQTHSRRPPSRSTRSARFGPPPRVLARRTSSTRAHSSSETGGSQRHGAGLRVSSLAPPVAADPAVVERVHQDHPDAALGETRSPPRVLRAHVAEGVALEQARRRSPIVSGSISRMCGGSAERRKPRPGVAARVVAAGRTSRVALGDALREAAAVLLGPGRLGDQLVPVGGVGRAGSAGRT